ISLLSLVGVLSMSVGRNRLHSFLSLIVAFASGTLLAASFLHMIPEAVEDVGVASIYYVLLGLLLFFFMEKFIHWHHCSKDECHVRPVAYLNLVADGLHNFIDGLIVAAAYLTSVQVGVVTTFAIALHEIPQEFGDFAVLLHSGMKTRKALLYNFISATAAIVGAVAGYLLLSEIEPWIPYVISAAAGGFIYIATADLMPELHKETRPSKMFLQSLSIIAGVLVIVVASSILEH
ncbi:MAG: ZIP family metal transporter, partial [Candidatus Altiarchaeota archaeon]|nr:ZIP family metal transporter [Candidatus Altiarchaeota archaeon]